MYAVTGDGSLPEGRFLFRYLPPPLTSAGRRGRRPLQRRSVRLLIAANLPGGLGAGRPTSHFITVRRGASPRRNSDGNAYVAYTKDSNEAGTYSEVSKTNKLDAGFTANANSTLNGKTGNEA